MGSWAYPSRRSGGRRIMAPQNLVGKTYALAADVDARTRDEAASPLLGLPAEGALGPVPFDLVALAPASEDHPAATFSFSFSFSESLALSLSLSSGLVGVRMMSSIRPYSSPLRRSGSSRARCRA